MSDYSNEPKKSKSDKNHINQKGGLSGKELIDNDEQIKVLSEIIIDLLLKDNYEKENTFKDQSNGTAT